MARPEILTKELGTEICKRISKGQSVRKIIKDPKMPSSSSIFRWLLNEDYKWFWQQYAEARNIQAEMMFEELNKIADEENMDDVMRARLRVDTRKWYLSKVLPKKFGDKVDITSDGKVLGVEISLRKDG